MTQHETVSTKITAVKAKSLVVRTNNPGASGKKLAATKERGPELAEQLNEETRQKYVKGVLANLYCWPLEMLTVCR